tara:strand:- start:189 stop:359 length:171 start_codon:yes stop_codon:yes gene_type:complete
VCDTALQSGYIFPKLQIFKFLAFKIVRRFFNNKVPLYFAILRGRNIPECVLVKLAV